MGSVWLPGRYLSDKLVEVTPTLLSLARAISEASDTPVHGAYALRELIRDVA